MKIHKATVSHKGKSWETKGRGPYIFDGFAADAIDLNVSLYSQKDIEELIRILEYTKPCFKKEK